MRSKLAVLLIAAVLLMLPCMTGCTSGDWEGKWNRTGDSTYSRAELTIKECDRSGFKFSLVVYNGNAVGRLMNCRAEFSDKGKTVAVYSTGDSNASITFTLGEDGMDVLFSSVLGTEQEMLGFGEGGYITGRFMRGDVDYLNTSLAQMGVISEEYDEQVRSIVPGDMYIRCMDCYQAFTVERHNDIGGFIYYGSNAVQENTAAIICYDDGSVSIVMSKDGGGVVYYSNNHIYSDNLIPYPLTDWLKLYNKEQNQ